MYTESLGLSLCRPLAPSLSASLLIYFFAFALALSLQIRTCVMTCVCVSLSLSPNHPSTQPQSPTLFIWHTSRAWALVSDIDRFVSEI